MSTSGWNKDGVRIADMKEIHPKNINTLFLFCCDGGNVYAYNKTGWNLASAFSTRVSGRVIAYDGALSFGVADCGESARVCIPTNVEDPDYFDRYVFDGYKGLFW